MNIGPLAGEGMLAPDMRITLLVATVTFGVVYVAMLIERYALRRGEADVDELYRSIS